MNKKQKLPLTGITVLDLTNVLSGPYASSILRDLGAKIIKVEKPGGDDSRSFGPFLDNQSCYFISLNRGKKSIVLNLKKKQDVVIFKKLLSKSDILIDNFRPGILEKFGFTWSYLSKHYPNLIHSKISGFGETGPLKDSPAYDIIVQALGGIMSITGDNKNKYRVGSSIGDIIASLFCVIGILSQLINRSMYKKGSKLDLSMLDCQIAILENAITRYSVEKKNPVPLGSDHPSITPFGLFKTKDNEIVIAIGNDNLFKKFCDVIDDKNMYESKDFSSNKQRNINKKKLRLRIEKKLKNRKTNYWIKKFRKNNIPCGKINKISDIVNDSQVLHRKMIIDYKDNLTRSIKLPASPLKFSFNKNRKKIEPAPALDEHREEILKILLD